MVAMFIILFVGAFFFAPIVALYMHSESSYWHSVCVADSARKLSRAKGHGAIYSFYVYLNGLFHDVGKILIPTSILHKNTGLTDEEFGIIKSHASNWIACMYGVFFPACVGHHKDFAGTGYGAAKFQNEVSAIIEVCDVHNAICGYFRTYRDVTPQDVVVAEMNKSERKFDPELFQFFMANIGMFDVSEAAKKADAKMRQDSEVAKAN